MLADALQSIRRSTYSTWECIVVDDGSTDDSTAVAKKFANLDSRFRLIQKANEGAVSCLNAARDAILGEIVVLLDADDTALPDRIHEVVARFRERPDAGLVVHRLFVTDSALRVFGLFPRVRRLPDGDFRDAVVALRTPIAGGGICTSNIAVRAEVYRQIFPADPAGRMAQDALIASVGPLFAAIAPIERVLGLRRLHGANYTHAELDELGPFIRESHAAFAAVEAEVGRAMQRLGLGTPEAREPGQWTLAHDYIGARLSRSDDAHSAASRFFGSPGFRLLPLRYRMYWRLMRRLPTRWFKSGLRALYVPTGTKAALQYFKLRLERSKWAHDLDGLELASFASTIRHCLNHQW